MVDQEAPPPGGHTDLTVNRAYTGLAGAPIGTPGQYPWALRHSHRIEATIPDRTFHFAEAASNRHEAATRFEETLQALGGAPVYLRFTNPENHGAARVHVRLGGTDYDGSVSAGFPAGLVRPGDAHATRDFRPSDLTDLVVEIRSLRLLAHLSDNDASQVLPGMGGWMSGGRCSNRPECVGQLGSRDEALALEIVRASDGAVVYDASMYWHTKAPGHSAREYEAEQDADAAWRAGVAAGTAYGTRLVMGAGTTLSFSVPRMAPIAARLGLVGSSVAHVGAETRHWVVGESAASSATGDASGVPVCAAGSTVTLTAQAARAAIRRGAAMGAC